MSDREMFSGISWVAQIDNQLDYLPATVRELPSQMANNFVDSITPASVDVQISNAKKGTDWLSFDLELSDNATVTFPVFAFPGFKLFDNSGEIPYRIEPLYGRIIVDLLPGGHQIILRLYNTPIRLFSDVLSLTAWILFIFLAYLYFKRKWGRTYSSKATSNWIP